MLAAIEGCCDARMTFWQVVNESAEGCEAPCLNAWVEAKVEGEKKLENWRAESSDQLGMLLQHSHQVLHDCKRSKTVVLYMSSFAPNL